jgi:hypothetical protein
MENIANVPIDEIFFPTITIPIAKSKQIPNIQMEHSIRSLILMSHKKGKKNTLIGHLITTMLLTY